MILLFLWNWTDDSGAVVADYPPRRWRVAALARGNKRRKRR